MVTGDTVGLYGGTKTTSCDAAAIGDFLGVNPQPAQAWAGALRISPGRHRPLPGLADRAHAAHRHRRHQPRLPQRRGQGVPVRVAGRHRRAGGRRGAAAGALLLRQPAADPGTAGQRPLRGEAVDGVRARVGHRHRAGTAGGAGVRGHGPRQRPGRRPATGDQGPGGQARRSGGQGSRRHHVRVQPDRERRPTTNREATQGGGGAPPEDGPGAENRSGRTPTRMPSPTLGPKADPTRPTTEGRCRTGSCRNRGMAA